MLFPYTPFTTTVLSEVHSLAAYSESQLASMNARLKVLNLYEVQ